MDSASGSYIVRDVQKCCRMTCAATASVRVCDLFCQLFRPALKFGFGLGGLNPSSMSATGILKRPCN